MITAGVFGMLTGIFLVGLATKADKITFKSNATFVCTCILFLVALTVMIAYFVLGATTQAARSEILNDSESSKTCLDSDYMGPL